VLDGLLCSDDFWRSHGERVIAVAGDIEPIVVPTGARIGDAALERATIGFWSPDTFPDGTRAYLGAARRAPNLRWLQSCFAGTDDPIFSEMRGNGVVVTSAAGSNAAPIAQTVMAYLLAFACDLPRVGRDQVERRWEAHSVLELDGRRLGIVGLGSIGRQVARLAAAFGMHVIGTRRTPHADDPCETWTNDRLDELLAWADAVVVCAPLTDRTRRSIGAAQFAAMRRGAWFVNVGRGEIVVEQELIAALESGHIGYAGLDVFDVEPLPDASPLWTMPNVIVTPHMSGTSEASDARVIELFLENLGRWVAGEPLRNVSRDELTH
jgi:D-2-hydroxyacid dehydrogenase (NADP+)